MPFSLYEVESSSIIKSDLSCDDLAKELFRLAVNDNKEIRDVDNFISLHMKKLQQLSHTKVYSCDVGSGERLLVLTPLIDNMWRLELSDFVQEIK